MCPKKAMNGTRHDLCALLLSYCGCKLFLLFYQTSEKHTLELLKRLKSKLNHIRTDTDATGDDSDAKDEAGDKDEELQTDDWLKHKLHFKEQGEVLAKDASTKNDDWHDLYDPRNPLNKRKRGDDGRRSDRDRDRGSDRDRDRDRDSHRHRSRR